MKHCIILITDLFAQCKQYLSLYHTLTIDKNVEAPFYKKHAFLVQDFEYSK